MALDYEKLEFNEKDFGQSPLGPSSKSCCKIRNGNSCGSGSLVGKRNGRSLVLSNAHVCSSRIGNEVVCTFPFANNEQVRGRVIMAAYSDRIMMDWAVVELEKEMQLPHVKLSNEDIPKKMYTMGYPRCRGPYSQDVELQRLTYNGTVALWYPNSIGGQSGSGVHSDASDLQVALLTWSWGRGFGAGQTTKSIWFQYVNRSAVGFLRPPGLIELSEKSGELEEGFFSQTNITTLPIWAHLDDDDDDDGEQPDTPEHCDKFAKQVEQQAAKMQEEAGKLAELARKYKSEPQKPESDDSDEDDSNDSPLFGL